MPHSLRNKNNLAPLHRTIKAAPFSFPSLLLALSSLLEEEKHSPLAFFLLISLLARLAKTSQGLMGAPEPKERTEVGCFLFYRPRRDSFCEERKGFRVVTPEGAAGWICLVDLAFFLFLKSAIWWGTVVLQHKENLFEE